METKFNTALDAVSYTHLALKALLSNDVVMRLKFKLVSVSLSCAGLRSTLENFWEENMTSPSAALGGFELALDASPDVLSSMVHFLATSTLLAPSRGHAQLELVKLAIELNMPLLTKLAVDAVHSQMTLEMVDEVHN